MIIKLSASKLTWDSEHINFTLPSKSPKIRSNCRINFRGNIIQGIFMLLLKSNSVFANRCPSVATHRSVVLAPLAIV